MKIRYPAIDIISEQSNDATINLPKNTLATYEELCNIAKDLYYGITISEGRLRLNDKYNYVLGIDASGRTCLFVLKPDPK